MIAYVDAPPNIEPHGDGFVLTLKSGDSETKFMLTLHALTGLSARSALEVKAAQAQAVLMEPTPFELRIRGEPPVRKRKPDKRKD